MHRFKGRGKEIIRRHRHYWAQPTFYTAALLSAVLFALSIVANTYAGVYATEQASNSVTDIILSNTPVFDIDGFFVYGVFFLIGFIFLLLLAHPKRIPFTLHSLTLFYVIRAGFVSLTHLGPYPLHATLDFTNRFVLLLFGGNDLFFSGHVGAPFLMALLFWKEKLLRYIFLAWSVFFAVVVLLGHIHYSIDVASAFFISFCIYHLALWLFPRERELFVSK